MNLLKSNAYRSYADACGMCTHCKEYTDVLRPCCNAGVWYEGSDEYAEDIISDIAYELDVSEDSVQEVIDHD